MYMYMSPKAPFAKMPRKCQTCGMAAIAPKDTSYTLYIEKPFAVE